MSQIKGPAIFLAQFAGDESPFNSLKEICVWASGLGFNGVQVPSWDKRFIDLELAAQSKDYCDELAGIAASCGIQFSELSTHLQGQLVAVHPAYQHMFDSFAPEEVKGNNQARTEWAINQLKLAAKASENLGLNTHASFSGALLWHAFYPWPQRPAGLVEHGFNELANRWLPILDAFDESGVDVCYELHPGEDLHDGTTFEKFLEATNNHCRANILYDPSHFVLQQLDYLAFIDIYYERIKAFHVKDAEFNSNGRSGVYGGYQDWIDRPGRFRSIGDGQMDFNSIFSKLTQYGFNGWAVLEWECCIKNPLDGAKEGAQLIEQHIIRPTEKTFDDFAGIGADEELNNQILGID